MSQIDNTAAASAEAKFVASFDIEGQERRGAEQVVESQMLPTERTSPDEEFEVLGIVFGEVDEGDPMWQEVTLPEGWERRTSDHDMWTYIHDERGIRRIAIFYKAAFYDRRAFARIEDVGDWLVNEVYVGTPPEDLPLDALTPAERICVRDAINDLLGQDWLGLESRQHARALSDALEQA